MAHEKSHKTANVCDYMNDDVADIGLFKVLRSIELLLVADGGRMLPTADCGRTIDNLRPSDIDATPFSNACSTRLLGIFLSR